MVNNFNNFGKFGNGVYYIMRTCHIHTFLLLPCVCSTLLQAVFRFPLRRVPFHCCPESHRQSIHRHSHLLSYRLSYPRILLRFERKVWPDQSCSGKSCRVADVLPEDCWKSHSCLRHSDGGGTGQHNVHHGSSISGGGTYLDAVPFQFLDYFDYTGNRSRIFFREANKCFSNSLYMNTTSSSVQLRL